VLYALFFMVGAVGWFLFWRERGRARRFAAHAKAESWLMRKALDVIPEPVLVKDKDLRLLMVNRAYAERAGLPQEELIGKTTHEFMPPDRADRLAGADTAVMASERDQVFELNLPNRACNAVRSYIVSKRNGVLMHWNKASETLFGYTAAEAIGNRIQDMLLEPRQEQVFERVVEGAWEEHRPFGPREVHLRLPNGRRIALLLTVFPVVVENVALELFSMAVDVSARHAVERQLAMHRDNLQALVDERTAGLLRAKQAVEQALQARSEFLANMSHELRTPMHAVLSFARLGEERADKGTPDKLRDYFTRIAMSGERLLALINNLLDLSKLEAGKMILDWRSTDLIALIHEAATELEPLIEKKGLLISLPSPETPVMLEIDALRIRQVLSNLLSNAIRVSPPSGCLAVHVDLTTMRIGRRATDTVECPAVRVAVSDEGPGIPAGELDLIFDKFVQSSVTRTGAGGTGLGLAICREIVHAHQGTIAADNRPEGGAVFEVMMPCQTHESAAD
jgi:PAS domain S-box-containing protein